MSSAAKLRTLVGFAVAVAVAAGVGDSHADTKVFHGSFCVQNGWQFPPATIFGYNIFGVTNAATSTKPVLCPVVRDNELSTMDVTDWDLTVDRNGATAAWTVQLWSSQTNGWSGFVSTITVPAGTGTQELDGGSITSAHAGGVMFLLSDMPPNARLTRYQITESD